MEKGTDVLVNILRDQWERLWLMWEEMINSTPDDEWRKGDVDYLIPARHLVHVLGCVEFFVGDTPPEQFDPARLFGVVEWGTDPEELPDRLVALAKLAEVATDVEERLAGLDDAALLQPETLYPWTGQNHMGRMLYVVRHLQHHLGEVNAELSRRDIRAAIWEKEKATKLGIDPWW